MTEICRAGRDFPPESEFVVDLTRVFRTSRVSHLAFLLKLHDEKDDRGFLSGLLLEHEVWIARVDHILAGFIAFSNCWVHHLYIAPAFQRQGLGRRLLHVAKEASLALQLWVFEPNEWAIAFYQSEGFTVAERTNGESNEARVPDLRMVWQRTPRQN